MTRDETWRFRARLGAAGVLAIAVFFPVTLELLGSLRVLIVGIGFAVVAFEVWLSRTSPKTRLAIIAGLGAYLVAAVVVIEILAAQRDDRLFAVNAEHLFVMLPLFAILGWLILSAEQAVAYAYVFVSVAVLVAVLAVLESLAGLSLLGRTELFASSQREGPARALVGAENVLVLGATLAAMVPLTLTLPRRWMQLAASVVVVAGVWATGSRAAALMCAGVAVVQAVPVLRRLLQRFWWVLQIVAGVVLLALAYLSVFVWRPFIAGATGLDYSSNYRGALYSLVPRVLMEHPLGYLLQSPPEGRWMIDSELHGRFDIARSIDSEIVWAIFGLGWIGLAFFVAALLVAIAALKHDVAVGLSALTLTAIGFIMALHGWDAMGPLWYGLIGACAGLVLWPAGRRVLGRTTRHQEPEHVQ